MPHSVIFLLGMVSVFVLKAVGTGAGGVLRPVIKGVVKGGILLGRQVQEVAGQVTEELQDVAAEASSEVPVAPKKGRGA